EKGLWRNPDLKQVMRLKQESGWNTAWAAQYWPEGKAPSFGEVETFLADSDRAHEEEQRAEEQRRQREIEEARKLAQARKRASQWLFGAAVLLALLLLVGGFSVYLQSRRNQEIEQ